MNLYVINGIEWWISTKEQEDFKEWYENQDKPMDITSFRVGELNKEVIGVHDDDGDEIEVTIKDFLDAVEFNILEECGDTFMIASCYI